jgi:anti-sigma regulatory factor (Ser/Thr protein kinase)
MTCLRLRAALANLETAQTFARENALRAGLDEHKVQRIELVLEEAIINIINHAYGGKEGELTLCCTPLKEGFEISLSDEGPPFNPLEAPLEKIASAIAVQRIGGMGLPLIRSMADGFFYCRDEGQNVLTLRFLYKCGEGT